MGGIISRSAVESLSPVVSVVGFLVHSNLLISLSATGTAVTTVVLVDLPLRSLPLFVVFSATLFVYSFNRIADLAEDERSLPSRADFTERYGRAVLAVGAALYAAAFAVALRLDLPGAPLLFVPAVVGFVYSRYAKSVLLVKNATVGAAWGAIPVGVGVYYDALAEPGLLFLSGFFAVALTVAAALFDIKDMEGDRAEGHRTLPIVLGPRTTRLASAAVLLCLVPAVVAAALILSTEYLVLLVFLAYMLAYTPFATEDRGALFYGFVIDGEHILLACLTLAVGLL